MGQNNLKYLGRYTMLDELLRILSNPAFQSFLLQYTATTSLDAIRKNVFRSVASISLENQVAEVFDKALEKTCIYYGWEYDSTAIEETLSVSWYGISQIDTIDSLSVILKNAFCQEINDDILEIFTQSFFIELLESKYKELQTYLSINREYRIENSIPLLIKLSDKVYKRLLLKKAFCESRKCCFYNSHILLSLLENTDGYVSNILKYVNEGKYNNLKRGLQKAVYKDYTSCNPQYPLYIDINNHTTIIMAKRIAYNNNFSVVDERVLFMALLFSKSNTIQNFRCFYDEIEYKHIIRMINTTYSEPQTPDIRLGEHNE